MSSNKLPLNNIPVQGQNIVFDDPAIWGNPISEFSMEIRIVEPLRLEVFILPQPKGFLLRGSLAGKIALPCDRCAEEAVVSLAHNFDSFEPTSDTDYIEEDEEEETNYGSGLVSIENDIAVLDVGDMCWEEFILSLPVKPLCNASCAGLCPVCGLNFNANSCKCMTAQDDPRLAALRSVVVKPGSKK